MKMNRPQAVFVDDDAGFLHEIVKQVAEVMLDFDFICVTSVEEFQRHIALTVPSQIAIVVADAVLGDLSRGTDVLVFCRNHLPHTRRLLMSNKASREDLEDAINRCALDGYLEKRRPFGPQELSLLQRTAMETRVGDPLNALASARLISDLNHIVLGSRAHANLFKNTMRDLLSYILYPSLVSPRTEIAFRGKTKSIDIMFQNAANSGIFADFKAIYQSLLVPIECKNTTQLRSSDFSQLETYLSNPVGRVGLLCFRGAVERKHILQIRGAHTCGKLLILITEREIVALAKRKVGAREGPSEYDSELEAFFREKVDRSIG